MLHGHTKIELHNVKTGEKKVAEHDNYMTNWLRDVLTPDMYGKNILATENFVNKPDFSKAALFGGVILFESPLSSNDADDYLFPQSNKMIAHGSNESYSGSDLTMGSFNSGLSVIRDNEATFIWDFTQERGNGTISALGLTNIYGGKAGGGHGKNAADINVSLCTFISPIWEQTGGNNYTYLFFDENNNKAFFIKPGFTSGKIDYRECNYNFSEYNPIRDQMSWDRVGLYINGEDKQINVSSYFSAFPAITVYNGKLYMCSSENWAGGSRTFVVYDFATETLTTQTITNATGKTLKTIVGNTDAEYTTNHGFEIWNNRMYFVSTDNHRIYIDKTDNTDCGIVKNPENEDIESFGEYCKLWDELIFADARSVTGSKSQLWVMTDKNHASRRNISGLDVVADGVRPCFGGNKARSYYMTWQNYYTASFPKAVYNFMALQTKNNLDSPVTKTSDMTMRVTYTIREAT